MDTIRGSRKRQSKPDQVDVPIGLAERVFRTICQQTQCQLPDITCRNKQGIVTLSGTVFLYYHKQIAQMIAMKVYGVRLVVNEIEVIPKPNRTPNNGVSKTEQSLGKNKSDAEKH